MAQDTSNPSRKIQIIWVIGFMIFATWLFYDRAEIYYNSDMQDAVIVGCASKGATTSQGSAMSRKNITVYTPIAVSEYEQKAVGGFWLRDKAFCDYQQGRAIQIFVHDTDSERNSINSFMHFWIYAYFVAGFLTVFLLSRTSYKYAFVFSLLAFAFAAYMVDREIGLMQNFQKVESASPSQEKQNEALNSSEDLSVMILNQCIADSIEKYNLSSREEVTYILCSNFAIKDLSSLRGLGSLRELYVSGSQFSSLESLPFLPKLKKLSIASNKNLTRLNGIENAPNLEELQANESAVTDLSGLENLRNLRVLALYNNGIEDVSAVAGLSKLEDVILSQNQISNIAAFADKPDLKKFQIYNNRVDDALVLLENTSLEIIGLRGGGNVPCQQIRALRAALPDAKVYGQKACD